MNSIRLLICIAFLQFSVCQGQALFKGPKPGKISNYTWKKILKENGVHGVQRLVSRKMGREWHLICTFEDGTKQAFRAVIRKDQDKNQRYYIYRKMPGKYRALLIGISDYKYWRALKTPRKDVTALRRMLSKRYMFEKNEIRVLDKNVTREAIFDALGELEKNVQPQDSVLIFYAGHGAYDKQTADSFWVPQNANPEKNYRVQCIQDVVVRDLIMDIAEKCKHVLLLSDSCYSGALASTRGDSGIVREKDYSIQQADYYVQRHSREKSCQVLTSGSVEKVLDEYKDKGHSPFAYFLLCRLHNNKLQYYDASQLAIHLRKDVANKTKSQQPRFGRLKFEDEKHTDGEFFFQLKTSEIENTQVIFDINNLEKSQINRDYDALSRKISKNGISETHKMKYLAEFLQKYRHKSQTRGTQGNIIKEVQDKLNSYQEMHTVIDPSPRQKKPIPKNLHMSSSTKKLKSVYKKIFTGRDLLKKKYVKITPRFYRLFYQSVKLVDLAPSFSGKNYILIDVPLVKKKQLKKVKTTVITITANVTRTSEDFDPYFCIGDGKYAVGAYMYDSTSVEVIYGKVHKNYIVAQPLVAKNPRKAPKKGQTVDCQVKITIVNSMTVVEASLLGINMVESTPFPIDVEKKLNFMLIKDSNDDEYQINALSFKVEQEY
ncbi:caspase family protein [Candidatus Uabimicrobium amorphum]|uniref:Polysaccharide deacetylase n=1 Tax=Uabimicrobium amorphum TaxID=2596890 RepID=A0A5S9F4Y8_UABAM|nr:caspase family protein [Candidatus Uabimicrobium amorphum]BBM86285.1 polysaccharide deacetylase [Candidatus Uabimicrobium amorphum]